jgi:hypothetical protein
MSRNTQTLKELIMTTLTADGTLQTLLGGAGKIRHANPSQLAEYPCVVYSIITEDDNAYSTDRKSDITNTRLGIQVFSKTTSCQEADSISDRIFEILDGQNLVASGILCYSCYRISSFPMFEPDVKVWRIENRFNLINTIL